MKRQKNNSWCRFWWNGVSWMMVVCLCGCALRKSFSEGEKEVVMAQKGKVMRLYTVESEEDSLFLRKPSQQMYREMLQTEVYRLLKQGLLETVQDTSNAGVGIAAPQVGIGRRLIVVQRFDKEGEPFEVYNNPEIIDYSSSMVCGPEGCLSVPGKRGEVERSAEIVVRYRDEETWRERRDTVRGFTAVIFQHETDHLNGILYTDKVRGSVQMSD